VSPSAEARNRSEIEAWLDAFLRDASFLEAYPYYAAILAKLTPVADPSVSRMAVSLVDGRFFLHVNIDAFVAEPQYLRGVLLHEVHHVVLGHLTHPKFAEVEERELMELALEMSANEYIDEPLPNPITWRLYSEAGMRAGQSTIDRYEKLVAHLRANGAKPRPAGGKAGDAVDDHRFLSKGAETPGGIAQTALLIERATETVPFPREEILGIPPKHRLAGKTPRRLIEELQGVTGRPEHDLDWQSALAMFVARARGPVHMWSRPNRRFPTRIFEVPGRTWAARRVSDPRLLVAIDTSLSMTRAELEEIARQLVVLSERAHVTIAECDVEVTRVYPFAGALAHVEGRGGTDLRPVFESAFVSALGVDGVVYFTDGEGPFPELPPALPTLWILTKPSEFRCPWGQRARLRGGKS
jgi:predicted metal-dependent peptidase